MPCSCAAPVPFLQPLHLHGSRGRDTATGRGVLYAAREFLKSSLYTKVQDCSFVIQVCQPVKSAPLQAPPGYGNWGVAVEAGIG